MNEIITRTMKISFEERILKLKLLKNVVDFEDLAENILAVKSLTENKPCLKLLDLTSNWKKLKTVLKYYINPPRPENTIALAIILKPMILRVIVRFFIPLPKHFPIRFFKNEKSGKLWLKKII